MKMLVWARNSVYCVLPVGLYYHYITRIRFSGIRVFSRKMPKMAKMAPVLLFYLSPQQQLQEIIRRIIRRFLRYMYFKLYQEQETKNVREKLSN